MRTIDKIKVGRIIAILRGQFDEREVDIAEVLLEVGVTAVEVTLNSPDALAGIKRIASDLGNRMAVGAGTVLSSEDVKKAADSGAQFMVSPNRDASVIQTTKKLDLVSVPGCFTPSEVIEALDAGADAAKVFPAMCLGPAFVKGMRGPLPEVRLVPTGGVTLEVAREYFDAGAWAVGVGSELFRGDVRNKAWIGQVKQRAADYAACVRGE